MPTRVLRRTDGVRGRFGACAPLLNLERMFVP